MAQARYQSGSSDALPSRPIRHHATPYAHQAPSLFIIVLYGYSALAHLPHRHMPGGTQTSARRARYVVVILAVVELIKLKDLNHVAYNRYYEG